MFRKKIKIETSKDGIENVFIVNPNEKNTFNIDNIDSKDSNWHGTKIYIMDQKDIRYPENEIKSYILQRFFTHPYFEINING